MSCVSMSVNDLARDVFSDSHGSRWPLPDLVPCLILCFLYTCFVVPVLFYVVLVTNFAGKWIMAY